jgi:voltage-gated potassium channel
MLELRRRVYEVLEEGSVGNRAGLIVARLIALIIVVNLIAIVLESMPGLAARYARIFDGIELLSLIVFTAEYGLRLWVAPEHPPYRHLSARNARLKFAASGMAIVDLLAVVPFWLAFALPDELRVLLVFRIVRFLKLARHSPGMRSLLDALQRERRALFGCLVIMAGAALFSATIMYLIERDVQPDKLGTIPEAMWWAVVTLGTIGYGDVIPVTVPGRIAASVTILFGVIMIALPVGIIATAFANEIHRREFVVTWSMVARVPLFAGLTAVEIADVMQLLRAQQVESGAVITRRGEAAHSMYFVAAGQVEIQLKPERVQLGPGHFFGEIAVLRRARRSATVTAVTQTSLLVLDAHDLHALMDREPRIAERMREMARNRLGSELVSSKGDLVTEELDERRDKPPAKTKGQAR